MLDTLGQRLRWSREQKGENQIEAAEGTGISNEQLNRYEKDKRKPTPEVLATLATYYNVTSDFLLGLSNDPEKNEKEFKVVRAEKHAKIIQELEQLDEDDEEVMDLVMQTIKLAQKRKRSLEG